jgi:hypothetical protein
MRAGIWRRLAATWVDWFVIYVIAAFLVEFACALLAGARFALPDSPPQAAKDETITGGAVIGEPSEKRFPWPFALQLDRKKPLLVEGLVF